MTDRPTPRRRAPLLSAAVACLAVSAGASVPRASGQSAGPSADSASPASPASPVYVAGTVTEDGAPVRSGPNDGRHMTAKLDRGQQVVVSGLDRDWLRIAPPPGSFLIAPKSNVDRTGGSGATGTGATGTGTVTRAVTAYYGSALDERALDPAVRLEAGQSVRLVGERGEYWLVAPSADVAYYVPRAAVAPDQAAAVARVGDEFRVTPAGAAAPTNPTATASAAMPADSTADAMSPPPAGTTDDGGATPGRVAAASSDSPSVPETGRADRSNNADDAAPAELSPPPVADEATLARLATAEQDLADATSKPLGEQPLDRLLAEYRAVAAAAPEGTPARQIADFRVEALTLRRQAADDFRAALSSQQQSAGPARDLRAEGRELSQRVGSAAVRSYAAVGTLRPSALSGPAGPMYRLADSSTGRTVVYLRADDPSLAAALPSMSGRFVAVRGDVVDDTRTGLRYVAAESIDPASPSDVYTTINAPLVPPSLAPVAPPVVDLPPTVLIDPATMPPGAAGGVGAPGQPAGTPVRVDRRLPDASPSAVTGNPADDVGPAAPPSGTVRFGRPR